MAIVSKAGAGPAASAISTPPGRRRCATPSACVAPSAGLASGPKIAGALFGGTLGYNQQNGAWVWGIEGDAGWTNARGSLACAGAVAFPQPLFNTDCRDKADWLGTATG